MTVVKTENKRKSQLARPTRDRYGEIPTHRGKHINGRIVARRSPAASQGAFAPDPKADEIHDERYVNCRGNPPHKRPEIPIVNSRFAVEFGISEKGRSSDVLFETGDDKRRNGRKGDVEVD
jgi:hypothetical protein